MSGQLYQSKVGRQAALHRINYCKISLCYFVTLLLFPPCNPHRHPNDINQWWEEWWQLTFPSSKYEINVTDLTSGWHNSNISATFFSHNHSQTSHGLTASHITLHCRGVTTISNKAGSVLPVLLIMKKYIRLFYFPPKFLLFHFHRRSFLMT